MSHQLAVVRSVALVLSIGLGTLIAPGRHPSLAHPHHQQQECPAMRLPDGGCSHGPDPAPPGFDVRRPVPAIVGLPQAGHHFDPECAGRDDAHCDGDGTTGDRVQVLYVRAADRPSRFAEYLPSIRFWAAEMDQIIKDSAAKTGGVRRVRFVQTADCDIDVREVVVPEDGDDNFGVSIEALQKQGYNREDRKYLYFMDALVECGIGNLNLDDRPIPTNFNNFGPGYARVDAGCWSGFVAAHEIMHTFGAVQLSAPHTSRHGHCTDDYDVMCYGDAPDTVMHVVCEPAATQENLLDCNNDDYFHTHPASASYLGTHWNTADSRFLIATDSSTLNGHVADLSSPVVYGDARTAGDAVAKTDGQPLADATTAGTAEASAHGYTPRVVAQACGIEGTVYDAGQFVADVNVQLLEYTVGCFTCVHTSRQIVKTDADGRYRFAPVRNLQPRRALYTYYRNADASGADQNRVSAWYGPPVAPSALSADGCGSGGDFDITNVSPVAPDDGAEVHWGAQFRWSARAAHPSLVADTYQICFKESVAGDNDPSDAGCIPAVPVAGNEYEPTSADRPAWLKYNQQYDWHIKVWNGSESYGLSRLKRPIRFTRSGPPDTPEPDPPTASPTPRPTPTTRPPDGAIMVCPGQVVPGDLTAELSAPPAQADIVLAFDATGSMGGTIDAARSNAQQITARLAAMIPDVHYGVLYFKDYDYSDVYQLIQPLTASASALGDALGRIAAGPGGMTDAEAYGRGLYEAYSDRNIGWRAKARRFVIMFGDQMPHDDDLNAGMPAPLVNPGAIWCGVGSSPCGRDPGRDGLPSTADDIDFQATLDELRGRDISLLFVVATSSTDLSWTNVMLQYWDAWAKRTNPAAGAQALTAADALPDTVADLVRRASARIGRVVLAVNPPAYGGWVESIPDELGDVVVPSRVNIAYVIHVPRDESPGATHRIQLGIEADGKPLVSREVVLHIKSTCPTPPPTPQPPTNLDLALPTVSNAGFPGTWDGYSPFIPRRGGASGRAVTGIQIQNTDSQRVLDAVPMFYPQVLPYARPDGNGRPRGTFVEMGGVSPGAAGNIYPTRLNLRSGVYSVVVGAKRDNPRAAIARTDWERTGAAALYSNVAPSTELSVPVVLRNYYGQTSILSVMSDDNGRAIHVEMAFFREGSSTPVSPAKVFELEPFEALTFDLLDNDSAFTALGDGFIGSLRLRTVYGDDNQPDPGARIGAVAFVNIATSDKAVWAFEAQPSGPVESRAAERLYVPLWRSRQCGADSKTRLDTGIAVVNPNDRPVEVVVDFYPTHHAAASTQCRSRGMFSTSPVIIPSRSSHVFYQGPGRDSALYPNNCFGSAVVRTTTPGDTILAVVNDAQNLIEMAAAYNAVPDGQTFTKVAVPLFRNHHDTVHQYTTGIQVMNVGTSDAEVHIEFHVATSSGPPLIPLCGQACSATIKSMESYTWWPPLIEAIDRNVYGSAIVDSTEPVAVIVNDYPLAPGLDSATYNGIPMFAPAQPRDP